MFWQKSFRLTILIIGHLLLVGSSRAQTILNETCLECHSDSSLTKTLPSGLEKSLFVDLKKFENSHHGSFSCVDCHTDITEIPHPEDLKPGDCRQCHAEVATEYDQSLHGQALMKGMEDAPQCSDCHGYHHLLPSADSLSMTFPANLPQTCAICHANPQLVKRHSIPIADPVGAYRESIHFKAVKAGQPAAACNDCHSSHNLRLRDDPKSSINRVNTPQTCGKCHQPIHDEYAMSVHGKAALAGVVDSPVCTDCHREHAIQVPTDPKSSVYPSAISKTTCPQCHAAERITSRYGLAKRQVSSYIESYHGLADQAGSLVTANCASCHGIHDILPSSDPRSKINKNNLVQTCGSCHPGVNENVTLGSVHINPETDQNSIIYYVRMFYIILIIVTIGGMLLHNLSDFIKKVRLRYQGMEEIHHASKHEATFVRLTLNERIQHFILMFSFTTLVITGFALVFPNAWWVAPFLKVQLGFSMRGILHRVAAAIFVILSIYHIFYLIRTKRGREQFMALLPRYQDVLDVIQMFKYYIGLSSQKPSFARFNYAEKAEYWALIWGTIVMSLTGFVLWLNTFAMQYLPKWVMDVSTVIHYYEAMLATLAIIVWHFYFVFLNPDVYPMNFACITGKISAEEMKHEHPLEYEALMAKENQGTKI